MTDRTLKRRDCPVYQSYCNAKARCTNPNTQNYARYGGRGIEFRFDSFEQFVAEVGKKPTPSHTLDRKNSDGHYEPGNVQWATPVQQANNTRRNHRIEHCGLNLTVSQWAVRLGVRQSTIQNRLNLYGWCEQCSVTLPKGSKCEHKEGV